MKQGDLLSSTLFNLVIEMVNIGYVDVPERLGIQFQGHRLFYLAFAVEPVLLTRGPTANQKLVTAVHKQLARVGLELHPGKCKSIAIMADSKRNTTFVDQGSKVTIKVAQEGLVTFWGARMYWSMCDGKSLRTEVQGKGSVREKESRRLCHGASK